MELDYAKLLRGFLDGNGKLRQYPSKMKAKIPALFYLAGNFEKGKKYAEREINEVINSACSFSDPATIRRDMVDLKFLCRTEDGKTYWAADENPSFPEYNL